MKWAGAVFIIIASLFIGWHKSKSYSERVRQIRQFETAFIMLESSIMYGADSMETAARSISKSIEKPASITFDEFANALAVSEESAGELWTKILKQQETRLALKKRDVQVVEQAGDRGPLPGGPHTGSGHGRSSPTWAIASTTMWARWWSTRR